MIRSHMSLTLERRSISVSTLYRIPFSQIAIQQHVGINATNSRFSRLILPRGNSPKFANTQRFPDLDSRKLIGYEGCDRYDSGGASACRTDKM